MFYLEFGVLVGLRGMRADRVGEDHSCSAKPIPHIVPVEAEGLQPD